MNQQQNQNQKVFTGRPKINLQQQSQQPPEEMMRKSSQSTKSLRTSGINFRPSSREKENEFSVNILNLAQDEQQFGSQIKVDLMQLQSEIDELDFDGKLRNASNMDFMKPYQSAMKKWLSQNSLSNIKQQIDKKSTLSIESEKLLEALNVKSEEEGLKKLFRLVSILDLMCCKVTEYEILFFLRFEDSYNQITKNQQVKNTKLGMLQGGINVNKFIVSLANIERFSDVIISSNKLQQENLTRPASRTGGFSSIGLNSPQVNLAGVKTRNDLIKCLEKLQPNQMQEDLRKLMINFLREANTAEEDLKSQAVINNPGNNANQNNSNNEAQTRIKQLDEIRKVLEKEKAGLIDRSDLQQNAMETIKKQNKQYEEMISELKSINSMASQSTNSSMEIDQKNKPFQKIIGGKTPPLHKDNPQYWANLIDDLKESFDERSKGILDENSALKSKMLEKNILIEKLEAEVNDKNEMIQDFKSYKQQLMFEWHQKFDKAKDYQDSYERALLHESERFKKGFEKKIQQLKYEIEFLKREKGRTVLDIRHQLDSETQTKNLLIKKLSVYIQI